MFIRVFWVWELVICAGLEQEDSLSPWVQPLTVHMFVVHTGWQKGAVFWAWLLFMAVSLKKWQALSPSVMIIFTSPAPYEQGHYHCSSANDNQWHRKNTGAEGWRLSCHVWSRMLDSHNTVTTRTLKHLHEITQDLCSSKHTHIAMHISWISMISIGDMNYKLRMWDTLGSLCKWLGVEGFKCESLSQDSWPDVSKAQPGGGVALGLCLQRNVLILQSFTPQTQEPLWPSSPCLETC